MKLFSTNCHAVVAAAIMLSAASRSQYTADAFAPITQANSRYNARVKGRESSILQSTVVPEAPVTKSTATKSPSKKKQRSVKSKGNKNKGKKSSNSKGKNSPVQHKRSPNSKGKSRSNSKSKSSPNSKGESNPNSKSFKPIKDLKLGSKISGNVVDVCDFGVFVHIGYATQGSRAGTALLHISQIQDKKVENIRDIIKVGDTIESRVINIDLKKGEVGLSKRSQRPKRGDFNHFNVGDVLEGKVDSVVPYGVFVDVGANVNALLHISRITGGAVENVRHHLNEGDPVSVHIIDLDKKKKTVAVSMLDKKADQYLDRRMSQRLKRFYGTTGDSTKETKKDVSSKDESSDLDYFDQAIRELEDALRDRD
mmetsp:Transcript_7663/g.17351  ORF Transcript_7663/g.17351 Transcript_7663/m.17351 type:complete len:367 (+) Transcript_7663:287-1387(+)|eukprot:CAMPEP_0172312174 /NCGR_PEP_ID=MMETSP1058-20130122/16915_1 /TAXON_ID=83371 /ORGANISM="Detonula confervacea, Strain CCMP 353" /LENGTH=366 /DNA_ID=CAMNT_0013025559 /DNA_START=263 /DNA_END=1366 /DNA_ORIENTATION=-